MMNSEEAERLDLSEKGRASDGRVISSDRRLFMQLFAYGGCQDRRPAIDALADGGLDAVLYDDINDPQGIAVLTMSSDPDDFLGPVRRVLNSSPFVDLQFKPEYTMFGRTYALGYEEDLEQTLIHRPRSRVHDPNLPWAIWYPLRRSGAFEGLSAQEQRVILMEHGGVGRSYGRAGHGYDVRLACYGLDKNDNDFVIGLIGPELYPLSSIVERMRKTKQTSMYLERLGPFFIGKAVWQSEVNE
ncbi:MAG: chlorite dismutase family protein [Chloroflexota bacterium]|jgi:chlorite dismutase